MEYDLVVLNDSELADWILLSNFVVASNIHHFHFLCFLKHLWTNQIDYQQ